jgi:hypothetical protein
LAKKVSANALPIEAAKIPYRRAKLLHATRQKPVHGLVSAITWIACILGPPIYIGGGMFAMAVIMMMWIPTFTLGLIVSASISSIETTRWKLVVKNASTAPFPVTGMEHWLLSGRPLLDIEVVDPASRDQIDQALGGHDVSWLSDRVARVESAPTLHLKCGSLKPFPGGDPLMWVAIRDALTSIHAAHPITAVHMGGYVKPRETRELLA